MIDVLFKQKYKITFTYPREHIFGICTGIDIQKRYDLFCFIETFKYKGLEPSLRRMIANKLAKYYV